MKCRIWNKTCKNSGDMFHGQWKEAVMSGVRMRDDICRNCDGSAMLVIQHSFVTRKCIAPSLSIASLFLALVWISMHLNIPVTSRSVACTGFSD